MKLKRVIICILFISMIAVKAGASISGISTSGVDILTIRMEPRALGMGGAFTSVANDINALYYNPGGLVYLKDIQGSLMYSKGNEDLFYGGGSFAHPISKKNGVGVNFNLFHLGDMNFYHADGYVENIVLGNSLWIGVSYAHLFWNDNIALGANLKFISSKLGTYSAITGAIDLGILYYGGSPFVTKKDGFAFGMVLQNLGPGLKYIKERDPLPLACKLGVSYVYHFKYKRYPFRFIIANDIIKSMEYDNIGVHTGMELTYIEFLSIRAGYQFNGSFSFSENDNGLTSGLGVRINHYQVDYALKISNNDLTGLNHYFSFTYHF